jgi:formate dehydrogenase subunit gamma
MLITGLGRVYPVFGPLGQEILYQVHRYGALAFVLGAVVHLYLGTIGNPGTFMVMLTGKVSKEWAEKHHPNWYESIKDPEEKK